MTDRCQSTKLTYEALPSTLILDPALLSLARQSYNHRTHRIVSLRELTLSFYQHNVTEIALFLP